MKAKRSEPQLNFTQPEEREEEGRGDEESAVKGEVRVEEVRGKVDGRKIINKKQGGVERGGKRYE